MKLFQFTICGCACLLSACSGSGDSPTQMRITPTATPIIAFSPTPAPLPSSSQNPAPSPTATGVPENLVKIAFIYYASSEFQPFSVTVTAGGVTQGFSNSTVSCGLPPLDGPAQCSVTAMLPLGSDFNILRAYGAIDNSSLPTAVGKGTVNVPSGAETNTSLVLNGVPETITSTIYPNQVLADGVGGSVSISLAILDNSGRRTVSPSTYVDLDGNPLTLQVEDSDASGATTYSPHSASAPTSGIAVRYNGSSITGATFTASIGSLQPAVSTLSVVPPPANEQHSLYVASHSASSDQIDVYQITASGSATPQRTITGSFSMISGLAVDTNGNLIVSNERTSSGSDEILIFGPAASGSAVPIGTIAGSNTALSFPLDVSVDGNEAISVLNAGSTAGSQFITTYASSNGTGNVAPTNTISGPNTMLGGSFALAGDSSGNIFVLNNAIGTTNQPGRVLDFFSGASGNSSPNGVINTLKLNGEAAGVNDFLTLVQNSDLLSNVTTSGLTNYCFAVGNGNSSLLGPLAIDAAGENFVTDVASDLIYLYPSPPDSTMCIGGRIYRTMQFSGGRTIDAIAIGP